MGSAIETTGLCYRAGRAFAIRDVSLGVPAGEVCGFLGPNGAGKTTVIRLLLGLLRPEQGAIRLLGRSMPAEAPEILARVGYVPERPHLDVSLTVDELCRFQGAFFPRWDRPLALRLAERLEIDRGKEFGRLSKGQKAKVMILIALAQRPELLVLDEPTDGLDPVVRREILDILVTQMREDGVTALMSSHLVHELEGLCTRIAVMDAGALVSDSSMAEFRGGIRRLVVDAATLLPVNGAPFTLLERREVEGSRSHLTVTGWGASGATYLAEHRIVLHEVRDLGLEEAYVHLLRAFRRGIREAA